MSVELAAAVQGRDEVRATADRDEVSRGFERLDADQRVVIVLRFYLDLTVDQIAERVGSRQTAGLRIDTPFEVTGGTGAYSGAHGGG